MFVSAHLWDADGTPNLRGSDGTGGSKGSGGSGGGGGGSNESCQLPSTPAQARRRGALRRLVLCHLELGHDVVLFGTADTALGQLLSAL